MEITINEPRVFPAGTTVKAYAASNWVGGQPPVGEPKGASVAEAVVSAGGTATLTGLTPYTSYYVAAEVDGGWHYLHVFPSPRKTTGGGEANSGRLNAVENGVLPGVTSTAAISAFFDLCHEQGKTAYFPGGATAYESGTIEKAYGLNVQLDENAVVKAAAGTAGQLWSFSGTLAAGKVNVEAEVLAGANEITVATTAGLAVGNTILVGTETLVPEGQATRYRGQLVEISEVVSGTVLKLREALYRTLSSHAGADKTYIQVVNAAGETGSLIGGKFLNPTGANTRFVAFKHLRGVDVDTKTDGQLQPGIEVQNVYGFRIRSKSEHGVHNNVTAFGYAVFAGASSCHGQVDSYALNGNYAFQGSGVNNLPGEPYDIRVEGGASGSNRFAVGIHPEGHDISFVGIKARDCAEGGAGISAPNCGLYASKISRCGTGAEMTVGGSKNVNIIGNSFTDIEKIAVDWHILGTMEDQACVGNVFSGSGGVAIRSTGKLVRYRQKGNTYKGYGILAEAGNSYCWRHEKQLEGGSISNEDVDASGGNNIVAYFDEEQVSGVDIAHLIVRNAANSGKEWIRNGPEGPKTIAHGCIVNGVMQIAQEDIVGLSNTLAVARTAPRPNWRRKGAKAETYSRIGARISEAVGALTSGRLMVYAIDLPPEKISSITFTSLGAGAALENQWFCLLDTELNVLGKTVDDGANAWGANAEKKLELAVPYTPAAAMAAYVGVMVKATTPPTLLGYAAGASLGFREPSVVALSTAGLTNPASLGAKAAALAEPPGGGVAYAFVS